MTKRKKKRSHIRDPFFLLSILIVVSFFAALIWGASNLMSKQKARQTEQEKSIALASTLYDDIKITQPSGVVSEPYLGMPDEYCDKTLLGEPVIAKNITRTCYTFSAKQTVYTYEKNDFIYMEAVSEGGRIVSIDRSLSGYNIPMKELDFYKTVGKDGYLKHYKWSLEHPTTETTTSSYSGTSSSKNRKNNSKEDTDLDQHDIEGYYYDNSDEYDRFEDAYDSYEDDLDIWDDYN